MVTDDEQDFQFMPTSTANDKMTIGLGRAFLGINRTSGSDFPVRAPIPIDGTTPADLEIAILSGALSLAAVGTTIVAILTF